MSHLYLSHNRLQHLSEAMVPAAVRRLHLDHNLLPSLAEAVVRRLEDRDNLTLALGDNPYTCRSEQRCSQLEPVRVILYTCSCDNQPLHHVLVTRHVRVLDTDRVMLSCDRCGYLQ